MMLVNFICIYFFIMVLAAVYSSAHIRSLNESDYARAAMLLCFAVCTYILGYSMELNSSSVSQVLFWNGVEYLGIPFVSALWLTVGLMYTGRFSRHKGLLLAVIYTVPFLTLIFRLTNDFHHLYFSSISFVSESGALRLVKTPGPWMLVQTVYSLLMILVTLGLFLYSSFQTEESRRGKIGLIAAASFFVIAGLIFSPPKLFGLHIDYMALCLPAACVLIILDVLRYDFLETKSVARSRVFESGRDAILLINRYGRVIDFNKSAEDLFEKLKITMTEEPVTALFQRSPKLLESLLKPETSIVRLKIDGEEKYYEISAKDINGRGAVQGSIKTVRDVTEIYKLNESLKRLAMMDELSGLSNRRAFLRIGKKRIRGSEASGGAVHLLMMDLDEFKKVNDRYGHQMGDRVIQSFGAVLKKGFPRKDLIARVGGEEFAVLLAGYSDAQVRNFADTVRRSMEAFDFLSREEKFRVTVSIGIAKKDLPGLNLDGLMRMADQALYRSKDRGRNCVTVYEGASGLKESAEGKESDRR